MKHAKVGQMGFRDMNLYNTLFDGGSLKTALGVEVDGMKKLLGIPPARVFMLLCDEAGLSAIHENDTLGAVTQLPGLEIILDVPVEEFAQRVLSRHYILAYGDHRECMKDFCRLAGMDLIE